MTNTAITTPTMSLIGSDHMEQLSRGVSAITLDPYRNILYYFFPFIGAFFSNYSELRVDPSLEGVMPVGQTDLIKREIAVLTDCAGIEREVVPYVAMSHSFTSSGGSYSLTSPALYIPEHHLFRRTPLKPFAQAEQEEEQLRNQNWVLSDNEVRFMISRELGQIKEDSALLRVAIKISVLAALFTIFATTLSWQVGTSLFIAALGMYIVSERFFNQKADLIGVEILGKRIANPVQVAISALEKTRQQNLLRRQASSFAKWYITKEGNNVLDFNHPFLTTRIEGLRRCEGNF